MTNCYQCIEFGVDPNCCCHKTPVLGAVRKWIERRRKAEQARREAERICHRCYDDFVKTLAQATFPNEEAVQEHIATRHTYPNHNGTPLVGSVYHARL